MSRQNLFTSNTNNNNVKNFRLRTTLKFCLHHVINSDPTIHRGISLFTHSVQSLTMFEAMYKNNPEYFKKFQKRFKYTICGTEPKPQDSGKKNYAYGYHSSSTVIDGCSFGSNHWHLIFEDTGPEDKIVFSSYAPATIPCLVTCFKFLILPTEKNIVTHGAIVSRLHVAVEYLSKFIHVSTNKTKKKTTSSA